MLYGNHNRRQPVLFSIHQKRSGKCGLKNGLKFVVLVSSFHGISKAWLVRCWLHKNVSSSVLEIAVCAIYDISVMVPCTL